MKAVKGNVFAVGIKGKLNTQDKSRDQWAQIVECKTGNVLHTGQPRYIKRVAKARYNTMLDIQWCVSSPIKASLPYQWEKGTNDALPRLGVRVRWWYGFPSY